MSRPAPPSGHLPPNTVALGGRDLDLLALARSVSDRYFAEFPDELERYGDAGVQWCRHDNQWIFVWAAGAVDGTIDIVAQTQWLARVLGAREYPVDRLVRNLEICADVAIGAIPDQGARVAEELLRAARAVDGQQRASD